MRVLLRRLAVPAVVLLEYALCAALVSGLLFVGYQRPDRARCGVDACAFDGLFFALAVIAAAVVVTVGFVAALTVAAFRRRRSRRRGEPDPVRLGAIAGEATVAAVWGFAWAILLSPGVFVGGLALARLTAR